jgi:hypothetical protein
MPRLYDRGMTVGTHAANPVSRPLPASLDYAEIHIDSWSARTTGLFVPKPTSGVIILGRTAADLLASFTNVRQSACAAAAIVTQLVTHLI